MKFCKIINNKFEGFFDKDIHKKILFTHNKETNEDILNEGFFEITDSKWNELLNNGAIRYVNGELININMTREILIEEGSITLESEKEKARTQREKEFTAYHKLSNNIFMRIEDELTEDESADIKIWHKTWKDVPNNYTNINIPIEESYPKRSDRINYYYN